MNKQQQEKKRKIKIFLSQIKASVTKLEKELKI